MMNWLQKISSVTFRIVDSERISQPKKISDLAYDLLGEVVRTGYDLPYDAIQSDGYTDDFVGTINWYSHPEIMNDEDQRRLIQQWKQEKEMMGYEINIRGPERSGMNDWGQSKDEVLMVYRLDILKNGSTDFMKIPDLNVASVNARALLGLLNIHIDQLDHGSIDLNDLRRRLALVTDSHMGEFTQDRSSENDGQYVNFGRSFDQIKRYVDALSNMVDIGIREGFKSIEWV